MRLEREEKETFLNSGQTLTKLKKYSAGKRSVALKICAETPGTGRKTTRMDIVSKDSNSMNVMIIINDTIKMELMLVSRNHK